MAKNAAHSEDEVKAKLRDILPRWFEWEAEVSGHHVARSGAEKHPRLDFWCKPLPELVALGWPDKHFAIEVKGYGLEDKKVRTACHLLRQALLYRVSVFPTEAGPVSPHWVLVYPPFSVILKNEWYKDNPQVSYYDGVEQTLQHFGGQWQVGELLITDKRCEARFWGRCSFDNVRGPHGDSRPSPESDTPSRG